MGDLRKTTDTDKNLFAQIIVICGFIISVLIISKNWKKSPKPIKPSNDSDLNTPIIPIEKSSPALDENKQKVVTAKENHATLSKFIEANEKLINVLGVFTAITVFVSELRLQTLGYALSFLFMTLTVILWLELWEKFPKESGGWKITWFENLLFLTVIALIVYWLIDFRDIWHMFLYLPIFIGLSWLFSTLMKKFNVFNRLFHTQPGKRKGLRYWLGFTAIVLILYVSLVIAQLITPKINDFLDAINQLISSSSP